MIDKKTISATAEKEELFYPDNSEIWWRFIVLATILSGLSLLLFMAVHASEGKIVLFSMFLATAGYVIYIVCYMFRAPKLYINKAHTYLHVKSSGKNEIIFLADIEGYDYFSCYGNPLKYPFLCLCVQIFLHNGQTVEFFAFMRGAQAVIDDKMSFLKIVKTPKL
ncbi:MAG: hypothetical protein J6N49_05900 [Alphaproteobacteria bacterium]|nr:hypothetical protein [Alphaproteobacteria bacterium]